MVEQLKGNKVTKRFFLKPDYALSERRELSQLLAEEDIDATFTDIVRSMAELAVRSRGQHRLRPTDKDSFHDSQEAIQ